MVTIDASVFVAADAADEAAHAPARLVLRRVMAAGMAVHEPTLAIVEVTSAVARRTGDAVFARAVGRRVLSLPGLVLHDLDSDAAAFAAALASDLRVRAGDAVYAATALVQGTVLITLDAELAARAASVIQVFTPADWLALQGE